VRLATNYERIHASGAELAAVSVDDDARQAGMSRRWGFNYTRFVSDPGGERFLKPARLFDPEERDGIALPGMLIFTPDGEEIYRYQGRDFADRTNDDDLWHVLDGLGLPAVEPKPWVPEAEVPDDLKRFFRPADLSPYYRGNFFGALAIGRRVEHEADRAIAKEHRLMARATLDAWEIWQPNTSA